MHSHSLRRAVLLPLFALHALPTTAIHLPNPSGPYGVGFTQHIFNHSTPNDPTPGPGTTLLTSIYYPTLSAPSPNTRVPYFDPTSAAIWGEVFNLAPSDLLSLETSLQWQAPLLPASEAQKVQDWPTLVFGPGGGMNAFMSSSLLSDLASQGYTVLALDHPGEAPYLSMPYNASGVVGWDIYMPYTDALILDIYAFRLADMLFLLSDDGFPALVREYGAYFNTRAYGAFGHSMGATQATGAMDRLQSIVAGFNIDGGLYGDSVNASLNGRPYYMTMNPTHWAQDTTWGPFTERYAEETEASGKGWLEWTTVAGAAHLAFSDIALWVELLPKGNGSVETPALGDVPGSRIDKYLKTFLGAFWEWVRGGVYYGEVLDGAKGWPEVLFNKTVRAEGYETG